MSKPKSNKESKGQKPKKAKEPRPDLCVFAFRLPVVDRDAIHKAAETKQMSSTRFVIETVLAESRKILDRS